MRHGVGSTRGKRSLKVICKLMEAEGGNDEQFLHPIEKNKWSKWLIRFEAFKEPSDGSTHIPRLTASSGYHHLPWMDSFSPYNAILPGDHMYHLDHLFFE